MMDVVKPQSSSVTVQSATCSASSVSTNMWTTCPFRVQNTIEYVFENNAVSHSLGLNFKALCPCGVAECSVPGHSAPSMCVCAHCAMYLRLRNVTACSVLGSVITWPSPAQTVLNETVLITSSNINFVCGNSNSEMCGRCGCFMCKYFLQV